MFLRVDPPPQIRLLTPKPKSPASTSTKSKGCAFLEFTHRNALQQALKLHGSTLDGRRINVELTAGGGGKSEQRVQKVQARNKHLLEERVRVASPSSRVNHNLMFSACHRDNAVGFFFFAFLMLHRRHACKRQQRRVARWTRFLRRLHSGIRLRLVWRKSHERSGLGLCRRKGKSAGGEESRSGVRKAGQSLDIWGQVRMLLQWDRTAPYPDVCAYDLQ